jgi:thiol-disulfide isomerase/thioredoxin
MKYILPVLIFSVLFLSCSNNKAKPNTSKVEVVTDKELQKIISARNGKPLLLNVWATWCAPCVEEFPAIIELNKKYNNNLEVIALSVDMPSEIESRVVPFLKKQGVSFKVIVADEKSSNNMINMLDSSWSGAVPVTFIYDKKGMRQKVLVGAHSYEKMKTAADSVVSL